MERFLDDQETPALPTPGKERSSSPVTSLIYGDPKRNQLKPTHTDSQEATVPDNCEPKQFDLSAASPTIVTVRPELKRPNSSSPVKHEQDIVTEHTLTNGNSEDLDEPAVKRVKHTSESSLYELQETYSETEKHIDKKSVESVNLSNSGKQTSDSILSDNSVSEQLHTITSHHMAESVAQ